MYMRCDNNSLLTNKHHLGVLEKNQANEENLICQKSNGDIGAHSLQWNHVELFGYFYSLKCATE